MRVLLDQNIPRKVRSFLTAHQVRTAGEMGRGAVSNGLLLKAAREAGFEVMVAADQNIEYQQNPKDRTLALVVFPTNDWNALKLHGKQIAAVVAAATAESCTYLRISRS